MEKMEMREGLRRQGACLFLCPTRPYLDKACATEDMGMGRWLSQKGAGRGTRTSQVSY